MQQPWQRHTHDDLVWRPGLDSAVDLIEAFLRRYIYIKGLFAAQDVRHPRCGASRVLYDECIKHASSTETDEKSFWAKSELQTACSLVAMIPYMGCVLVGRMVSGEPRAQGAAQQTLILDEQAHIFAQDYFPRNTSTRQSALKACIRHSLERHLLKRIVKAISHSRSARKSSSLTTTLCVARESRGH
jgi:hypothetical protein